MIRNQAYRLLIKTSSFCQEHKDFSLVLLLAFLSFCIYGRYVFTGKFGATGDFPPAVSYALNFWESVKDGQWIPRWVIFTREFTLGGGGIDGTMPTVDSPAFQYYAFLQSALAYPFLCLGVPAIAAVQLVVILAFAVSAIVLYFAGRTIGASRPVAFFSGYSYFVSPWLVSNFYGRGGISEALGQSALPLLILGYCLAIKSHYRNAVISVASGIIVLALAHNIFLLYGAVMCFILMAATFQLKPLIRTSQSVWLFPHVKIQIVLLIGLLLGMAAASWQWLPAMMTVKEFDISPALHGGLVPQDFSDLSGAWGLPQQFVEPWSGVKREFFFTIGWWTIPGILSLLLTRKGLRGPAVAVALCFVFFFIMTYFPKQIFPYMPGYFGATQFTFRLLAFLSVLGSFAFSMGLPKLPRALVIGMLALITISQIHVIRFPLSDQQFPDNQYLRGYEYNAFYANSARATELRSGPWLDEASNVLHLQEFKNTPVYLSIKGKTRDELAQTSLFIAPVGDPAHPVSNRAEVRRGNFKVTLKISKPRDNLRIYSSRSIQEPGGGQYSIRPEQVMLLKESFIPATDIDLIQSHGYQRVFVVKNAKQQIYLAHQRGIFTIELPMIYNKFAVPFQKGIPLFSEVDFNHRLNIKTSDLKDPIVVRYSLPNFIWLLTGLGLSLFCGLIAFTLLHKRDK